MRNASIPHAAAQSSIVANEYGNKATVGLYDDLITAQRFSDIAVQFQYNVSNYDLATPVTAGSGSVTQATSQLVIGTGATAASTARIDSFDFLQYHPGHDGFALFTAEFTTPTAASEQYIGLYDAEDGFRIGYDGTQFCLKRRKGSSDVQTVNREDWSDPLDGDGRSGFNLDPTKNNQYRIAFGWLGIAPIVFQVYAGVGKGWITFHVIDLGNKQVGTTVNNPVMPIRAEVIKTSGSEDITIKTGSWNAGRYGALQTSATLHRRFTHEINAKTAAAGVLTPAFSIRSGANFQGKTNKIISVLEALTAAVDGTKNAEIYVLRNATLTGATFAANINATNSIMELDTAATVVTDRGIVEYILNLGKVDHDQVLLKGLNIHWHPNEVITFAILSVNATEANVFSRWKEEF